MIAESKTQLSGGAPYWSTTVPKPPRPPSRGGRSLPRTPSARGACGPPYPPRDWGAKAPQTIPGGATSPSRLPLSPRGVRGGTMVLGSHMEACVQTTEKHVPQPPYSFGGMREAKAITVGPTSEQAFHHHHHYQHTLSERGPGGRSPLGGGGPRGRRPPRRGWSGETVAPPITWPFICLKRIKAYPGRPPGQTKRAHKTKGSRPCPGTAPRRCLGRKPRSEKPRGVDKCHENDTIGPPAEIAP